MENLALNGHATVETKAKKLTKITVAPGDGIGPEIMKATLKVMQAAGAEFQPDYIEVGESVYESGNSAGIGAEAWEKIRKNKILLKAPITTPQGKGYKSLNVTIRKSLGLFANVRPSKSYFPFIDTKHPALDIVVIRENEEDLYAGIEHQQTEDVVQCLKLITRPGCERIVRYAFEYARAHGRRKVTCLVKDNIMKMTDGLFHRVFDEIGQEYPQIEQETQIIDIGTARVANQPDQYDVVVLPNLYGDILSDVVAEITGSVGLAGSANIGMECSMFEAVHGSAPDIAGKNVANPSGLINAAAMMLAHIGQTKVAERISNAWMKTIEDGIHTADIYIKGRSLYKVGTQEFAEAIVGRMGQKPESFAPVELSSMSDMTVKIQKYQRKETKKELVGVDVFLDWKGDDPQILGEDLIGMRPEGLKLKMITNRGVKVFPNGMPETFCTDHWRCRFVSVDADINYDHLDYTPASYIHVVSLLLQLHRLGYEVIKTENLYRFDGVRSFSLGQGE